MLMLFIQLNQHSIFFPFVWWDISYRVFMRQQSRFRDPLYRQLPPEKLRRILMVVKSISVMAKNKRELKKNCTLFFYFITACSAKLSFTDKHKLLPLWFLLFSQSFLKSACLTQALRSLRCFGRFYKFLPTGKVGVALVNVPWWQILAAKERNSGENLPSATHPLF